MPDDIPASIHQAIGSLNAKADQSGKDVSEIKMQAARDVGELRVGQGALKAQIDALPSTIQKIIQDEIGNRLEKIETRLTSVETTVNKWKAVLAILAFSAGGIGWLLSHLDVRKVFGGNS